MALAGAAWLAICRHYREHYGRMTPPPRQQARDAVAVVAAIAVVFGGSLLLRSRAGWSLDLPVNAIAVSFARDDARSRTGSGSALKRAPR